jgi:hypothetical protein
MLGRKDFTRDELDGARAAVEEQVAAFRAAPSATDDLDRAFASAALLALDRRFVHRLRVGTGKDSNPLNEVELLVESLLNNGGVLRTGTVVKYVPEQTVLGLQPGDRIAPSVEDFARLADAFLTELEKRFVG